MKCDNCFLEIHSEGFYIELSDDGEAVTLCDECHAKWEKLKKEVLTDEDV